eukprot:SAG31_NODE_703_length_12720_cov_10.185088_4_plen_183_part_00
MLLLCRRAVALLLAMSSAGSLASVDQQFSEASVLRELLAAMETRACRAEEMLAQAQADLRTHQDHEDLPVRASCNDATKAVLSLRLRVQTLEQQLQTQASHIERLQLQLNSPGAGSLMASAKPVQPSGGCRQSQRAARRAEQRELRRALREGTCGGAVHEASARRNKVAVCRRRGSRQRAHS